MGDTLRRKMPKIFGFLYFRLSTSSELFLPTTNDFFLISELFYTMTTEDNGNIGLLKPTLSSTEDLSEYTDADESMSAPTEFLAEVSLYFLLYFERGCQTITGNLY